MKLLGYEEHFEEKCQEIDEKYQSQIEELKQANIELRYRNKYKYITVYYFTTLRSGGSVG